MNLSAYFSRSLKILSLIIIITLLVGCAAPAVNRRTDTLDRKTDPTDDENGLGGGGDDSADPEPTVEKEWARVGKRPIN
jgi:hypothetical protein